MRGWATCPLRDRKSTRLNSSHLVISYAVFCLKKKTELALRGADTPRNNHDGPDLPTDGHAVAAHGCAAIDLREELVKGLDHGVEAGIGTAPTSTASTSTSPLPSLTPVSRLLRTDASRLLTTPATPTRLQSSEGAQ